MNSANNNAVSSTFVSSVYQLMILSKKSTNIMNVNNNNDVSLGNIDTLLRLSI